MVVLGVIQSECGKIQTRITPNTDTIYAVLKTVFQLTKSFYNSRENHFFISIIFSSKAVVTLKTAIFNSFRMKNMGFFELLNLCLIEEH